MRHKNKKVSYNGNMKKRNQYSAEFKSKIVLEVLQAASTINEIAAKHSISPVTISRWKGEFMERAAEVFKKGPSTAEKELKEKEERIARLERKVGQLTYEVDWLKKNLKKLSDPTGRKDFIDRNDSNISVKRQAELLSVNRTSVYRQPLVQKQ